MKEVNPWPIYYHNQKLMHYYLQYPLVKWMPMNYENEEKKKKEKAYDFKRALRFSKDQIRSIDKNS